MCGEEMGEGMGGCLGRGGKDGTDKDSNSLSISNALTFSPPVLMMSTLFLPRMKYIGPLAHSCALFPAPSTILLVATSPVLNHLPCPSSPSTNSDAVACGLRQYSLKTVGPRSWISPSRSLPSLSISAPGAMTSCVSVSTRRACTKGSGQPTLPSTRSWKSRPQDRAMPTSVMP